ncbi:MAG TPA: hypothetical protein VHE59_20390 [Mucilaginibacter sp.]|nr:hypothetical protein [Mucilaginibacter sp.]
MTRFLPVRPGLCFCIVLICVQSAWLHASARGFNINSGKDSTTRAEKKQYTNAAFDQVYRENLLPAFYGNEYGQPDNNLLVADVIPNVVILNTAKSRFFFVVTPRIQLRLLQGYHSPVKSPSYMPGGTLFSRLNSDENHPKFMSLSYSHHSNGQEGQTLDSAGNFNHDGKFTTNFYSLNYYFGKRSMTATAGSSQYASVGLEIHTGLFGKGYSQQLKNKYGFIRTNASWMYDIMHDKTASHDHYLGHQRIRFDLMYIWDKVYDYPVYDWHKRMNISIKYYYQFGFMENVAATVQVGYRGQDPYNIYFQQSYPYIGIGLASGVSFDMHKRHHNQALAYPTD